MQMPQVLILARNEFHRRLMADLVACNEMRVLAAEGADPFGAVERGDLRADVVVIDCRMARVELEGCLGRIRALPEPRRPRIVAVSAPDDLARARSFEECLPWPLDVGDFARRVKEQAQAQVLALEV